MEDLKNKGRRLNWQQAFEKLGCGKTKFYALVNLGKLSAYWMIWKKRGFWVYESDCASLIVERNFPVSVKQDDSAYPVS